MHHEGNRLVSESESGRASLFTVCHITEVESLMTLLTGEARLKLMRSAVWAAVMVPLAGPACVCVCFRDNESFLTPVLQDGGVPLCVCVLLRLSIYLLCACLCFYVTLYIPVHLSFLSALWQYYCTAFVELYALSPPTS